MLNRDNWRCQSCGHFKNLEVHHKKARSQGGDDYELNLITLLNAIRQYINANKQEAMEDICVQAPFFAILLVSLNQETRLIDRLDLRRSFQGRLGELYVMP